MKNLDLILAILGGAVVGAAVGLLIAPKKGEDLRNDIADYLESKGIKLRGKQLDAIVEEIESEVVKK